MEAKKSGEYKVEVRVYVVHYYCDKEDCDGEMLSTGVMLTSDPPQYPHECNKCGESKTFDKVYPYTAKEPIPENP